MARILAISSQVARGHVGLAAIVPACQALGHEVIALPTILLSNHPGHAHAAGERIAPAALSRMLDALDANGWLADIDGVLTGYLPSPEHVQFAVEAVERVRASSPRVVYVCDAILGDLPKGLYIAPEAATALRDGLVGRADILKGNAFEIGWLAGPPIDDVHTLAEAALRQGWREVIATSVRRPTPGELSNVWLSEGAPPLEITVAERSAVPKGTGDLLSALLLGHILAVDRPTTSDARERVLSRAVANAQAVVEASIGREDLHLVAALDQIRASKRARLLRSPYSRRRSADRTQS